MIIKNKFGEINPLEDIDFRWTKTLGISMSGGADSTMLCYLLAKCISEDKLNMSIQPYNGYDMNLPEDSNKLPYIIEYIRNRFPEVDLRWPMSVVFPNPECKDIKNLYIRDLVKKMMYKNWDARVVGITLGPPIEVQEKFKIIGPQSNIKRLPGYHLYREVIEHGPDSSGPFKTIDKRFVIQCYKDFNMIDLLEKTESCTENIKCTDKIKCWWCTEREWAIKEVFNE
tara:strand:- start:1250 stop:1930 length:681 start_codon:yes stop_codon:yes gene_type:complete